LNSLHTVTVALYAVVCCDASGYYWEQ